MGLFLILKGLKDYGLFDSEKKESYEQMIEGKEGSQTLQTILIDENGLVFFNGHQIKILEVLKKEEI